MRNLPRNAEIVPDEPAPGTAGEPDEANPSSKAPDPRKHPYVVAALKRAGRWDPAADPFKPVARSSFVVWLVILVGAGLIGFYTSDLVNYGVGYQTVSVFLSEFINNGDFRSDIFGGIEAHPQSYLFYTLGSAVVLSLAGAFYYLAIYLVGLNTARGLRRGARHLYNDAIKPLGRAIGRATKTTIEKAKRYRRNRHGPDPDQSLFER